MYNIYTYTCTFICIYIHTYLPLGEAHSYLDQFHAKRLCGGGEGATLRGTGKGGMLIDVWIDIWLNVCICIYIYIYKHYGAQVREGRGGYMYIYIFIYIYTYIYIFIYVYIYIYIYIDACIHMYLYLSKYSAFWVLICLFTFNGDGHIILCFCVYICL
jgi:hypothetical protein